jgi:hypothetical protein
MNTGVGGLQQSDGLSGVTSDEHSSLGERTPTRAERPRHVGQAELGMMPEMRREAS